MRTAAAETRVDRWIFDADATGRQFTPPRAPAPLPPRLVADADTSKAMARLVLENQELKQKLAEQRKPSSSRPMAKDDGEQRLSQAAAREAVLRAELAELKRRFSNLESRYHAVKSELAKARRPATPPVVKRDENVRLNEAPPPPPPARPSAPKPSITPSKHGGVTMVQGRLHVRAADGALVALDDWCRRQCG